MIKQLQTAFSVVGLALILVLGGCGSETALDPAESSVAATPSSTVESEPESGTEETSNGELPVFTEEETWPSDPVVGVWYRLDFQGLEFCGTQSLTVPGTAAGMMYYQVAAPTTFRGDQFKTSEDGQVLLGFARLRDDGSVDYSHNGADDVTNYQLVLRSDINFICE